MLQRTLVYLMVLSVVVWGCKSDVSQLPRDSSERASSEWKMFRSNPQRQGRVSYKGPDSGNIRWQIKLGGTIDSSPSIDNQGNIYIGSFDGYVYSINPEGQIRWKYPTEDAVSSSPALDNKDDRVYVGSRDGNLYAITKSSGELVWKKKLEGPVDSSPVVSADNRIFVGCRGAGNVYAISPKGELEWKVTDLGKIVSSPCIDTEGNVYIGSWDNKIYSINNSGKINWEVELDGPIGSTPALSDDGFLYVGAETHFYRIKAKTGNIIWKIETGPVASSPAIGFNNFIYLPSYFGTIYAFSPSGEIKWEQSFKNNYFDSTSPAIDVKGNLYVGYYQVPDDSHTRTEVISGGIRAFTRKRNIKWEINISSEVLSSPSISPNGTLYFGCGNGYLYAIGP